MPDVPRRIPGRLKYQVARASGADRYSWVILVWLGLWGAPGAAAAEFAPAAKTAPDTEMVSRRFDLHYVAAVDPLPPGAQVVDLWLPVPIDGLGQQVESLEVLSPLAGTLAVEPGFGNRIFHHRFQVGAGGAPPAAELKLRVTRSTYQVPAAKQLPAGAVQAAIGPTATGPPGIVLGPDVPAELAVYLGPARMIPLDGPVAELSAELALAPGETIFAARKIYDLVLERMTYNWAAKGAGHGDTLWACDSRTGDCTDYHSLFIALCRAHGIPADHEFGLPLKPGAPSGKATFCHCWARFWEQAAGWVPVDASEADKHPELREVNFGTLSANYVRLAHGRDVTLAPPQAGPPLNMFDGPYAEIDGQPVEKVRWHVAWQEIATAAP